jgi:L-fuconolactonase
MPDVMRIDAHHHLWDLDVRDQPWTAGLPALRRSFGLDDLAPELAAAGIDRTVLVQTVTVPEETPELLALAAEHDVIAGVVGWADLTAPDLDRRLDALQALPGGGKLVAIRHQVQEEPDPRWLARADVLTGLRVLSDQGLAYDLLIIPEQFPAAIEAVAAVPELRFVLDHGGKPQIAAGAYEPWVEQITGLAALGNVAVKLSGLVTEADPDRWTADDIAPYAETMITAFGAGRVMYGSDWPVCNIAGGYQAVYGLARELTDELSEEERELIFSGTARNWYRLQESA